MLLQLVEEFLSRTVDTRTHGAHGDLQHPGNLIVGEFFKAVEDEGFAQSVGEILMQCRQCLFFPLLAQQNSL